MLNIISKIENDIAELKKIIARSNYDVKFIHTDTVCPKNGQAVWVKHRNGAVYRLTYPFNHKDYPLWYPLPEE